MSEVLAIAFMFFVEAPQPCKSKMLVHSLQLP